MKNRIDDTNPQTPPAESPSGDAASNNSSFTLAGKLRDYLMLFKFSLNIMVVFSAVICYLLAPKVVEYNVMMIVFFAIGGFLVTGSANTINQIVEKDTDAKMKRTAKRPIASGRMSETEGWIVAVISGAAGIWILGTYFNWLCAGIALFSLFLYAFIYTPLKKVNSISVLVGAVPGALPCLIGWAAGNDELSAGGWALFAIQFFWQFPHFWAIAWVGFDDYAKAGIRMLPSKEGKTRFTGLQCMFYSLVLIPMAVIPRVIGLTGNIGMWVCMACGVLYFAASFVFYKRNDFKSAKRVMFSSFIYLPIVLLALLFDKM